MRYAQMVDMVDTLPDEAKQPRYAIFRANRRTEQKKNFRPIGKILLKEWAEKSLKDTPTLQAFLSGTFGRGGYFIEPWDEHGQRMTKVAAWFIHTHPEDNMRDNMRDPEDDDYDDEEDEDSHPRRSRFRRRYRDDVHDDDYLEERANVSDVLATATKAHSAQAMQANQSKDSLVSMLLLTQTQGAQAKAEDERRREDRLAEERRFERERMDRKEREDKEERERRDRLEKEDRDRKDKEAEQRRADERHERELAENRRRDDDAKRAASDTKRTEIMMAAITGLAPILVKLLDKPLPPAPAADPMAMILLKSFVDKQDKSDSTTVMFQQMGEMAKLQSTVTAEGMKSMMTLSNDMNQAVMKKALDMMMSSPQGQTTEGKSMIEQIMMAVQGAAELVKTLAPTPPAPIVHNHAGQPLLASPQDQNPNRRFARGPGQQQQPQPQQQPQQQQPQQLAEQQEPVGIPGVLHALRGIHLKGYNTNEEYQVFIQYIFQQIPLALRVAVLEGNDIQLYQLTKPAIDADPVLSEWTKMPDAVPWMRQFIPQLKPTIAEMFGAADKQRHQLDYLLTQGEQGRALALATPADFQAYIAEQNQAMVDQATPAPVEAPAEPTQPAPADAPAPPEPAPPEPAPQEQVFPEPESQDVAPSKDDP